MSITKQIENIIQETFHPITLEILNQSHLHAGHGGDDGSGESHFKIIIVSDMFIGKSRLARHRMVFEALEQALPVLPHALSITAFDPAEK